MRPNELTTCYVAAKHWPDVENTSLHRWLTVREATALSKLRDSGRRRQWLAARLVAKPVIQEQAAVDCPCDLEITTCDDRGRGAIPRAWLRGRELPWSLSISHTQRGVLVALAATPRMRVGVDLVQSVPDSRGFRRLWFTAGEQRWLAENAPRRIALLWAIKEAVYKACNQGESWSPRNVEVLGFSRNELRFSYRGQSRRATWFEASQCDAHTAVTICTPSDATCCAAASSTASHKFQTDQPHLFSIGMQP